VGLRREEYIDSLALGLVVTDLVQEQFLDGVERLFPGEEDRREPHVAAERRADGAAQRGGQRG